MTDRQPTHRQVADPVTLVDCRWLGYSGVGRVTETFLAGLGELRPPGRWVLWGAEATARFARWPGAEHVRATTSPLSLLGQRGSLSLPRHDRALFLHAVRPLRVRRRAVVFAHDTIPVRFAQPRWKRPLQRAFYALSVRSAGAVLAASDATIERLWSDLRLPPDRVRRVRYTIDRDLAEAVRARRRAVPPSPDRLLYVGLHRPQKNLERAVLAFGESRFAAAGGRFTIVGVQADQVGPLAEYCHRAGAGRVEVLPRCSDEDLVGHLADATLLVQPALEEGYGLTVMEALAAEVPVCCSGTGALAEAAHGLAETFDPLSVESIADAIDRAAALARDGGWAARFASFADTVQVPTPAEFASVLVSVLDQVCAGGR